MEIHREYNPRKHKLMNLEILELRSLQYAMRDAKQEHRAWSIEQRLVVRNGKI